MRRFLSLLLGALYVSVLTLTPLQVALAAPPTGFIAEDVITDLQEPDTLDFSPTGEMFVAERTSGRLRIATQGSDGEWSLAAQPFHTFAVPDPVRRSAGLRDIAFDQNYASNGHVYVFYMDGATLQNKVVRITRSVNPLVSTGTETLLIDIPFNATEATGSHNGGAVVVGDDNKIYIATGDGWEGCCPGDPVQSLTTMTGKLLRINKDGSIPTDNPFYTQTTGDYRAIYALGLRNPFTMSKHPTTGVVYINDAVGADKAEIFIATAGANYGHEANGAVSIGTRQFAWANTGQHGAELITGGAWYPESGPFPSEYHGAYFTAMWGGNQSSSGHINYVRSNTDTTVVNFDNNVGVIDGGGLPIKPVKTKIGPDGNLYYILTTYITNDGTVVRVKPTVNPTVETPTITPASGNYTDPVNVVMSSTTVGAEVRYTLDGSEPSESSTLYTGSFAVAEAVTIKAKAFHPSFIPSQTTQASYTFETGAENQPPVVDAGAPQVVTAGQTVILDGSATTDPDGDDDLLFGEQWTQLSGPETVTIIDSTEEVASFLAAAPGVYEFELSVSDAFDTANDTTLVDVVLPPPPAFDPLRISFQPTNGPLESGWTRDDGSAYTNNAGYGWIIDDGIKRQCGDRNNNTDQNIDTFCHTQSRYVRQSNGKWQRVDSPAYWQAAVPNGTYDVTASVGDAKFKAVNNNVQVNGTALITDADLNSNQFEQQTTTINVTDGFITLTFNGSDATRVNWVEIVPDGPPAPPTVATPTFSPAAGNYTTPIEVALSSDTNGADIYYTTDGSEPTAASTQYESPISLSSETTIRAKAFLNGYTPSAAATAVYTFNNAAPVVNAGDNQTVVRGDSVTLIGAASDANSDELTLTWSQISGSATAELSTTTNATTNFVANEVGTYVFQLAASDYFDTTTDTVQVSIVAPTVAAPEVSPSGGNVASPVTVSIVSGTPEATIYFTLDGSEPDEASTVYGDPFVITDNTTVKARAFASGFTPSAITEESFTFTPNTPPTVDVGFDQQVAAGSSVVLSGTASDVDGDVLSYQWVQVAGPEAVALATPDTATTSFTPHTAGVYTFELRVSDGLATARGITLVTVVPSGGGGGGDPLRISFQPTNGPLESGWTRDDGSMFTEQAGYGWVADDNVKRQCGDRNNNTDQTLDTFCHTQSRYERQPNGKWLRIDSPAYWQATLPNGTYEVTVSVGDSKFNSPNNNVQVNGTSLITDADLTANQFEQQTTTINVTDGKITLTFDGSAVSRVNWVEIVPLDGGSGGDSSGGSFLSTLQAPTQTVETSFANNTVYIPQLYCSGYLIRTASGAPVGAVTAKHCGFQNEQRAWQADENSGETYVTFSEDLVVYTGDVADALTPVATVASAFVSPDSDAIDSVEDDVVILVFENEDPQTVRDLLLDGASTPALHSIAYLSGWPELQGENDQNTVLQRQTIAMRHMAILDVYSRDYSQSYNTHAYATTGNGAASCTNGMSGALALNDSGNPIGVYVAFEELVAGGAFGYSAAYAAELLSGFALFSSVDLTGAETICYVQPLSELGPLEFVDIRN